MLNIVVYHGGAIDWAARLTAEFPDVGVHVCDDDRSDAVPEDSEILVGWKFPSDLLKRLPKLRWIQLLSTGADDVVASPWIDGHVAITNTSGVYSDSVADYVLWALLTLSRNFHVVLRNQSRRRWRQVSAPGLHGKTMVILGMGRVGSAVAIRAKSCGLRVVGIKRTVTASDRRPSVDELYAPDALPEVLRRSDAIVLALPLTAETRGLLDAEAFGHIKSGAILVNIARAALVDEAAMLRALRDGRLSGAALDVFDQEPVSRWSRLWATENLLVTPHLSGLTRDYPGRVGDLLCENIRRYRSGQPLLNRVDRIKGY